MDRRVALVAVLLLALAPGVQAQDEEGAALHQIGWSAARLPQTEEIPALAKGVAVGPDSIVAVGQHACELTKDDDLGRCWGQPWISTDGLVWEAIEARTSGLDLGVFPNTLHGPEFGLDGLAFGPGGFVAYGWAVPAASLNAEEDREPVGLEPTLWRSDDGRSWSRVPTPEAFATTGLMLTGPWLRAIAGTDDGFLLGGTIYGTPAPRAAIWSSPDGLTWTLAGPDEAFDIGAYIDTMEVPVAGGITTFAVEPSSDGRAAGIIAVGSSCPKPKAGAGPRGRGWKQWDWTTGECRARIWRSDDGVTWKAGAFRDASGSRIKSYAASTVAATEKASVVGAHPKEVFYSRDDSPWEASPDRKVGRQRALAASGAGFHAFVPKCEAAQCRRKTLAVWSSADGAHWSFDASQPTLPSGVDEFVDIDTGAFGDRTVVTISYLSTRGDDWASVALLSPPWSVATTSETEASPEP